MSYWKRAEVLLGGGSSEEIVYATEKLIGVGRARHAVSLLGHHINAGVPSELIVRVLRTAVLECSEAKEADSTEVTMLGHYVAKLINLLEANPEIGQDVIAELEWAYFPILRHSERPPRTLQRALASDPAFFLQLLRAVYLPSKESGIVEPEPADPKRAQAVASQAWHLLQDWRRVPGTDDQGAIDAEALEAWVKETRMLCASCGRTEVGDSAIGKILAAADFDTDGIWPPVEIRDVIEITRSRELENGILVGVRNRHGSTIRRAFDGGTLERDLAATVSQKLTSRRC